MSKAERSRSSGSSSILLPKHYRELSTEELASLKGIPTPRIQTPRGPGKSLEPAVSALAEIAGLEPWEWQRITLDLALELNVANPRRWAHRVVTLLCSRQNGKTRVILLRILAGLYLFRESLIIHTAADRALPRAVFEELVTAIEDVPELRAEVHKVRLANGTEELTLKGGRSYRIVAPRQDAVRGWSVDCFIVDEAREQRDDAMLSAGLYMQRAVPNPQLWIVSNAGDPDSVVLRRYRDRGLAAVEDPASDPEMCLVEYSTDRDPEDPNGWIESNPALGISIDGPTLLEELRSDDPLSFRTEALCAVGRDGDGDGGPARLVAPLRRRRAPPRRAGSRGPRNVRD